MVAGQTTVVRTVMLSRVPSVFPDSITSPVWKSHRRREWVAKVYAPSRSPLTASRPTQARSPTSAIYQAIAAAR